jgi:hypothetical protein
MNVKAITIEGENVIIPASEYDRLCYVEQRRNQLEHIVLCTKHFLYHFPVEQDPAQLIGLVDLRQALKDAGYDV